ncbi:MAG: hypothetical protein E7Z99_08260 [Coriobacteriaceae bacterium]|jgi:cytochrome b subunit of formate dehydrogenase|nr:hypothetical protein [Coriobacteriaceae bacterium]
MVNSLIERQMESAVQDMFDDRAVRFFKGLRKIASRQGGESTIHNYQLLGKRALIAAGITIITVQTVGSIVGFVISRKNEEKRVERIVRRVLEEERQKEMGEAPAQEC